MQELQSIPSDLSRSALKCRRREEEFFFLEQPFEGDQRAHILLNILEQVSTNTENKPFRIGVLTTSLVIIFVRLIGESECGRKNRT
jgi:hypothetical protein